MSGLFTHTLPVGRGMPPPFWTDAGSGSAFEEPWQRRERQSNTAISVKESMHRGRDAKRKFVLTFSGVPESRADPWDGAGYLALLDVLMCLATREDPDEIVEPAAIMQTCRVLAVLIQGRWPPPRVHWHGGDAMVLSWTRGTRDILLTITEEGQSLLVMKGGIVQDRVETVALEELEKVVRPRIEQNCFYAYRRYY